MATPKQTRYIMALLKKARYSTKYMDRDFKDLGASMRERSGTVQDWVEGLSTKRASAVIDLLKEEIGEEPRPRPKPKPRPKPRPKPKTPEQIFDKLHALAAKTDIELAAWMELNRPRLVEVVRSRLPQKDTRIWHKRDVTGYSVGNIANLNKRGTPHWVVITKAGRTKTSRATEIEEDMGLGVMEGEWYTVQDIEYRPATSDEIQTHLQAVEAAKPLDPHKLREEWRVDAEEVPEKEVPSGLEWVVHVDQAKKYPYVGEAWATAEDAEGNQWARWSYRRRDDWGDSYYVKRAH